MSKVASRAPEAASYPIRTVSSLTGVNPVTLRAWERRYGLIRPQRTPTGHRLYSREDIELINEVVLLLNEGIPISQVHHRLESDARLAANDRVADVWGTYQGSMSLAIESFDEHELDQIYNETLSLYPVDVVTERLIKPVLTALGERWEQTQSGIAEEHFFATYLRNKLGARLHHLGSRIQRPRVLAACLPGDHHETGLLLFCLAAASYGYGFVILGADTPLEELPHPAERAECDGILLSGSVDHRSASLFAGLRELVGTVSIPVFLGGQCSVTHNHEIDQSGAIALGTDTHEAVQRLGTVLRHSHNTV